MVPERIPGTLTASSSSPMDSCGRDPICRPNEPRFLSPKASFTDHDCGGDVAPQQKLHYPNGAAIRKVGQKRGSGKFGQIGNGKSASLQRLSAHCWHVYQDSRSGSAEFVSSLWVFSVVQSGKIRAGGLWL